MRLSIAYLFWATIIGFLIQIFLTLGKTGVGPECTPPIIGSLAEFLANYMRSTGPSPRGLLMSAERAGVK